MLLITITYTKHDRAPYFQNNKGAMKNKLILELKRIAKS